MLTKYFCEYIEDVDDFDIREDDPEYDGPVANIADPVFTYHVEAGSVAEAMDLARIEMIIDRCEM